MFALYLSSLLTISPVFIPLYSVQFALGPIPTNIWECIVALLFISTAYVVHKKGTSITDMFRMLRGAAWFWFGSLLILFSGISLLWTSDVMVALGIIKSWMVVSMIYLITLTVGKKMIDRSKLIKAFVFSGLIYALTGLFQFIGLTEIVTLDGRISGFLGSANYLAMYLLPLILLSASYWMYDFFITKARSTYMWNELVVVLAMIFVLGLTVSYNAFLALLFAGVYLIFRLRLVQAALVFVSIFIVFLVTQLGSEKLMQAFEFDDRSSSSVRTEVYEVTGQLISERPLTGYGLGSYESVYLQQAPRILEKAPMEWVMIHPHNTFLSFFYQLGIFGAVWFVILLLFYWAKLQKFVDRVDRRQAIALSSAFLGILFLSLFDTHFWKNDFAVQFFLLLWLIDSVRQKHTL